MDNIAFKDVAGGPYRVFTSYNDRPRYERIKLALADLEHMGGIKIYLYRNKKMRLLTIKKI